MMDTIERLMALVDKHREALDLLNDDLLSDMQYELADAAIGDTRDAIEAALRELLGEPVSQPVIAPELTDAEILTLAHQTCTTYAHVARIKYGFTNAELLLFARAMRAKQTGDTP